MNCLYKWYYDLSMKYWSYDYNFSPNRYNRETRLLNEITTQDRCGNTY